MKNILIACCSLMLWQCTPALKNDPNYAEEEVAIRALLIGQQDEWNKGNIDGFMEGYWKSDSLYFVGTAITKGWNSTLERYRKSYPDLAAMGILDFTFYKFQFVTPTECLVTGRHHLKRAADDPTGMFTLLVRKIEGRWLVVYDHTS